MNKKKDKTQYEPVIEATLDLHGCRREEARSETIAFLEEASAHGMERVLIIVGKGLHSPDGAVLPDTVKAVLTQYNLSYKPATLQYGGEGALEVQL